MNNIFELVEKLIELNNKHITTLTGTGNKDIAPDFTFKNVQVASITGDFIQLVKRGNPAFRLAIY